MAANVLSRDGIPTGARFEPVIESEVLDKTNIMIEKKKYTGESVRYFYTIVQNGGKVYIPKAKMEAFAKELMEIAETYSGNWNAEIFR